MPVLQPVAGNLGETRARHLLKRLTFGPNPARIQTFAGMSAEAALNQLFSGWTMPQPPTVPDGTTWVNTPPAQDEEDGDYQQWFRLWWLGSMHGDNSALEKLTFFLHTVITTKQSTVDSSRALYFQNALFRQYLLNDFSDTNPKFNRYSQFIKKICVDNAMLKFLDGRLNEVGRPNENFARELMELFSIGKGETIAEGNYTNYTEADIKAAAKVLTGWEVDGTFTVTDPDTGLPTSKLKLSGNVAHRHDNSIKTFSSALSSAAFPSPTVTPASLLLTSDGKPTAESVADELDQFIQLLFAKEQTARFLCRKVYRFFVHYQITSAVENDVIAPLAQTFIGSGFRLRPVLEQLFRSEHFYEAATGTDDNKFGAVIKSPVDITLGTMRYFGVSLPPLNTSSFYDQMKPVADAVTGMGLDFLEPYDVAGYEPYHQSPGYSRNWITTNTLANRYNFIRKLLSEDNGWGFRLDALTWAESPASGITDTMATTPTGINEVNYAVDLVKHALRHLLPLPQLGGEITQERLNYFAVFHLGGLSFDNWVFNWNNRNNGNVMIRDDARARLNNLLNAVMQSPEYQLG